MKVDLKTKMESDFARVSKKLARATDKANAANKYVQELERQQAALESALDILAANGPVIQQYKPVFDIGGPPNILPSKSGPWASSTTPPEGSTYVEVAGAKLLLEPGFKYIKSAEGEDILVPENFIDAPQTQNVPPPAVLPPISADEGFAPDGPGGM